MRKFLGIAVVAAALLGCFAIWPIASAFQIKQAIKVGDVATLERKVYWAPVRASLKASLAELSASSPQAGDEMQSAPPQPPLSLWSRIKATAKPMLADRLIDTYVTAAGVSSLSQARTGTVASLLGLAPAAPPIRQSRWLSRSSDGAADSSERPEAVAEDNLGWRFLRFYNRIVRARFHSLSVAEFEIADQRNPARRFVSTFELSNFEWKLASVRVVGIGF